jgi:uncharacterized protein DUF5753/uncharacterized protein DUF397
MAAVIHADRPELTDDDDDERRIALRQERQGLLARHFPAPPRLEVIVSEAVLWSAPETPGAMAQQLWHLLKANEMPHMSVRVLPFSAGPHRASVSGAFTILEFPSADAEKGEPSTIYSEALTGALYLDKPRELTTYEEVWASLGDRALTEQQSGDGDCVEVADNLSEVVAVRDSKDPSGTALFFAPAAWAAFISAAKNGEFDR